MTRTDEVTALEAAAREDHASVLELARDLVQIPSRGGIDPYDPVLDCMASWLHGRGSSDSGKPRARTAGRLQVGSAGSHTPWR
jgi:hypothetical protein